jgi:hypothetical protein
MTITIKAIKIIKENAHDICLSSPVKKYLLWVKAALCSPISMSLVTTRIHKLYKFMKMMMKKRKE